MCFADAAPRFIAIMDPLREFPPGLLNDDGAMDSGDEECVEVDAPDADALAARRVSSNTASASRSHWMRDHCVLTEALNRAGDPQEALKCCLCGAVLLAANITKAAHHITMGRCPNLTSRQALEHACKEIREAAHKMMQKKHGQQARFFLSFAVPCLLRCLIAQRN